VGIPFLLPWVVYAGYVHPPYICLLYTLCRCTRLPPVHVLHCAVPEMVYRARYWCVKCALLALGLEERGLLSASLRRGGILQKDEKMRDYTPVLGLFREV